MLDHEFARATAALGGKVMSALVMRCVLEPLFAGVPGAGMALTSRPVEEVNFLTQQYLSQRPRS